MKASRWFICAVALALFGGCVSHDTGKLRLGMTKSEVFAVMGRPDSVGAEGRYEYLNFSIPTQSGYRSSTFYSTNNNMSSTSYSSPSTQSYVVRLADDVVESFGVGSQTISVRPARLLATAPVATIRILSQNSEASENGIRILSITPTSAVIGKTTEFNLRIAYSLQNTGGGSIQLGFNTRSPHVFYPVGTQLVSTGSGELDATVQLEPKDWGRLVAFTAQASITSGKVLAQSKREITLTK